MIRTLPQYPHLGFLKHQAKDLQRSHQKKDPSICSQLRRLARFQDMPEMEMMNSELALHEAQYILAMEYGFRSWNALKAHVESCSANNPQPLLHHNGDRVWIEGIPDLGWGRSGECTYAGALAAALSITEHPFTYTTIMGLTGLAFRVRWWQPGEGKHGWCPSSPVGEFPQEKNAFQRLSGWEFADVDRMVKEEDPHMEVFYVPILDSINMGYPVIGYPEKGDLNVAVAFGHERSGETTLISWNSYWNKEPKIIPVDQLGPWFAYPVEYHPGPDPTQACMEALQGEWWRDHTDTWTKQRNGPGYLRGDSALSQWIEDLGNVDQFSEEQRKSLFFVNWWCFDCLWDARQSAAAFLNEKASLFSEEAGLLLRRAAGIYSEELETLGIVFHQKEAFLGPWTGKSIDQWTPEVRAREAALLESVRAKESRALALLDESYAVWQRDQPVKV